MNSKTLYKVFLYRELKKKKSASAEYLYSFSVMINYYFNFSPVSKSQLKDFVLL